MSNFAPIGPGAPLVLMGGGKMGNALLSGWMAAGLSAGSVLVIEPYGETAASLRQQYKGLEVLAQVPSGLTASVLVLAVKPQVMDQALAEARRLSAHFAVSIAAGVTTERLQTGLNGLPVIRAMPNTPAAIGQGISAAIGTSNVTDDQKQLADALLSAVGSVVWLPQENLMDAVTALSGSGPAYVFLLAEVLSAAGTHLGLPVGLAEQLARQTVAGAGALLAQSDDDAAHLRRNVTSPGGTTEAALNILMADEGLAPLFRRALEAAARRSKELSEG